MTPNEYRQAIAALNLTQVGAATLLGVSPRTSRRWALGESEIPESVALALRLLIENPES
jgi:DNA-binding transcriptional regulator YiaG